MKTRILISSDAWNQTNGVVRTLKATIDELEKNGFTIDVIHPGLFHNISFPLYKEIKLIWPHQEKNIGQIIQDFKPDYVHIAVEGPVGVAVRNYCIKHNLQFTTAYHTHFPAYLKTQYGIPESLTYQYIKWFHTPSSCTMVATDYLMDELPKHGITKVAKWSRGVDVALFNLERRQVFPEIFDYALYVGRVSVEKNIEEFLKADTKELQKVVVGDGPHLAHLRRKYPKVHFVGKKSGIELAQYYANATVFVFPSRTDTFGLVMIEALASGVPVAALDIPHNHEIVTDAVGCINDDLSAAIAVACEKNFLDCRNRVWEKFTWDRVTHQFMCNLVPVN